MSYSGLLDFSSLLILYQHYTIPTVKIGGIDGPYDPDSDLRKNFSVVIVFCIPRYAVVELAC